MECACRTTDGNCWKRLMSSTTTSHLTSMQRRELQAFGERIAGFGVNFAIVDAALQVATLQIAGAFDSDAQQIIETARQVLQQSKDSPGAVDGVRVWQFLDEHRLT